MRLKQAYAPKSGGVYWTFNLVRRIHRAVALTGLQPGSVCCIDLFNTDTGHGHSRL